MMGEVVRWIENWLRDKKHKIVLNGVTFAWFLVNSSALHGSVLDFMFFTIYGNSKSDEIVY